MALSATAASGLVAAGLTKLATDAGARDAVTGAAKGAARDVAYQAGKAAKAASPVLGKAARTAGRDAEHYAGRAADAVRGIPGAARGVAHDARYFARKGAKAALRKTADLRKGLSAEQIKGELSRFKGRAQKAVMDGVSHFKFTKPGGGSAFVTKSTEGVRGPMTQAAYRAHVGARDPFVKSGSGFKQGRLDKAVEAARAGFKKRDGLN